MPTLVPPLTLTPAALEGRDSGEEGRLGDGEAYERFRGLDRGGGGRARLGRGRYGRRLPTAAGGSGGKEGCRCGRGRGQCRLIWNQLG